MSVLIEIEACIKVPWIPRKKQISHIFIFMLAWSSHLVWCSRDKRRPSRCADLVFIRSFIHEFIFTSLMVMMCHWNSVPTPSSKHSAHRILCPVISHQVTAPCLETPVSLCPLIVPHPPSHLLTLSQSSLVSPSRLHHPGSVHVDPSPCLSSWGSRTHTIQQPPDIHMT